jgi:hypothetical protein
VGVDGRGNRGHDAVAEPSFADHQPTTSQRYKSASGHDEKPKQFLAGKRELSYIVPDDQKEAE